MPPVGWVGHLAQAVVADGDVGGDQGPRAGQGDALEDAEARLAEGGQVLGLDRLDPGERGRAAAEGVDKGGQ